MRTGRSIIPRVALYVVLCTAAALFLLPVYVALAGSFKTLREVNTSSIWSLPSGFHPGAWREALTVSEQA
jgi:ABC-type glycerol-3-phosphate transport system permease component